jgi:hypothetical protein
MKWAGRLKLSWKTAQPSRHGSKPLVVRRLISLVTKSSPLHKSKRFRFIVVDVFNFKSSRIYEFNLAIDVFREEYHYAYGKEAITETERK